MQKQQTKFTAFEISHLLKTKEIPPNKQFVDAVAVLKSFPNFDLSLETFVAQFKWNREVVEWLTTVF